MMVCFLDFNMILLLSNHYCFMFIIAYFSFLLFFFLKKSCFYGQVDVFTIPFSSCQSLIHPLMKIINQNQAAILPESPQDYSSGSFGGHSDGGSKAFRKKREHSFPLSLSFF